jgi:hypothetical protein
MLEVIFDELGEALARADYIQPFFVLFNCDSRLKWEVRVCSNLPPGDLAIPSVLATKARRSLE